MFSSNLMLNDLWPIMLVILSNFCFDAKAENPALHNKGLKCFKSFHFDPEDILTNFDFMLWARPKTH